MQALTLRQIRDRLGLTQREFAIRLGTHRVRIAEYERGTRAVSRILAYRIANEFGVRACVDPKTGNFTFTPAPPRA